MSDSVKKASPNRTAAIVVAVVVIAATAVGFAVMSDRHTTMWGGPGYSPAMHDGRGQSPGWMMMGQARIASESEYLAEMVAHHQEAVDAADELTRSDRPDMRDFGAAIVRTQSAQIQQMKEWLRDWYPDQHAARYRPMMRDLSNLSGDDLDRAFLHDMIGHHMAAVMMSQHLLFAGTEHDDVKQLAQSIRDDQHAEIIQMQRWLSDWFNEHWRVGFGVMPGFRS